jgi:hypothetical protein
VRGNASGCLKPPSLHLRFGDYLEMEQRLLAVARSYEFTQRLSNFTEPFRNRKQSRNRPPQLAASVTRERPPPCQIGGSGGSAIHAGHASTIVFLVVSPFSRNDAPCA